ncbi:hypothetical protein NW759_012352 [Fusarium solani]|nr:hypothetical protein NW759_012352 [Fusarium solani]
MAREIAPSPTELELLEHIKGILEEAYYDFRESISLAAGVARAWAMFLQDVRTWGVTSWMGSTLELLAQADERSMKSNRLCSI